METLCNQGHLDPSPRFGQHSRCSLTDEDTLTGSNEAVNKIAKCSLRASSFIPLDNKSFEVYNLAAAHLASSMFGRSLDVPIRPKKKNPYQCHSAAMKWDSHKSENLQLCES